MKDPAGRLSRRTSHSRFWSRVRRDGLVLRASRLGASLFVGLLCGCDALIGIQDLSSPTGEGGNAGTPCQTPSDCPDTGDPCVVRACTSQGLCELREAPDGPVGSDPEGNCLTAACVAGVLLQAADDTDFLPDGNSCTTEGCGPDGPIEPMNVGSGQPCDGEPGLCDGGGNCYECLMPGDCTGTEVCLQNQCAPPGCANNELGGQETDIDCGGPACPPCADDADCDEDNDCVSSVCLQGTCQSADCDDNELNGNETDKDCGGPTCDPCEIGRVCLEGADCLSQVCDDCENAGCRCSPPACDDAVENGTEVGVDCGPECLGYCQAGQECMDDAWCFSFNCDQTAIPPECLDVTCEDGIENGDEEGVDCGGSCLAMCMG